MGVMLIGIAQIDSDYTCSQQVTADNLCHRVYGYFDGPVDHKGDQKPTALIGEKLNVFHLTDLVTAQYHVIGDRKTINPVVNDMKFIIFVENVFPFQVA